MPERCQGQAGAPCCLLLAARPDGAFAPSRALAPAGDRRRPRCPQDSLRNQELDSPKLDYSLSQTKEQQINLLEQNETLNRNLNFRSFVLEWGVLGELNLLPFNRFIEQGDIRHYNFTPFIYGGLNVFHFNPKTYYNGQWIALQPLSTEGQNTSINADRNYRLTQLALPFGFGFKYQLTPELTIAYEMGARKTFTDYLDDVSGNYTDLSVLASEKGSLAAELSYRGDEIFGKELTSSYLGEQRGNSSNKDWYLINSLSISYKLYKRY